MISKQDYDFLHEVGAKAVFGPGTGIPEAAKDVLRLIWAVRGRGESGERISRHEFTLPKVEEPTEITQAEFDDKRQGRTCRRRRISRGMRCSQWHESLVFVGFGSFGTLPKPPSAQGSWRHVSVRGKLAVDALATEIDRWPKACRPELGRRAGWLTRGESDETCSRAARDSSLKYPSGPTGAAATGTLWNR